MSLFLFTFFLLYGSLHYYLFTKVRDALTPGVLATVIVAFFMFLMVIAPLVVYFAGKHGFEGIARPCAHIGYIWMGFAFLFFAASVAIDLYRLLALIGEVTVSSSLPSPSPFLRFIIPLVFAAFGATYGYFDALNIRMERMIIPSSKIPAEPGRFTVAQISDVHLGVIVRKDRLARIMNRVKSANPDLFISTGDLVDGQLDQLNGLSDLLQEVRPRYGKFAITGNHEYYAGLPQAVEFTRRAGFTLLRGEARTVGDWLNLAGVDDPAGGTLAGLPEQELLSGLPRNHFTLFLKHRPVVEQSSLGLFDLQVSGHTHRGQIFPFVLLTRIFFTYYGGFFQLPGQALLYVSRGSGTWGPPIRFFSPPEVTVYELVHKE